MQPQAFFPYLHKDNASRQLFTSCRKSPTYIIQSDRLLHAERREAQRASATCLRPHSGRPSTSTRGPKPRLPESRVPSPGTVSLESE